MANKKLVLIIDDEINIQLTLSHILTRAGFQVMSLVNDEGSIDKVITNRIDLVVIDFDKEDKESECPLSRIRHKLPGIPLIVLTHDPAEEIVHCVHKFDHCELIFKPIDPETILATITRTLGRTGYPEPQPGLMNTD